MSSIIWYLHQGKKIYNLPCIFICISQKRKKCIAVLQMGIENKCHLSAQESYENLDSGLSKQVQCPIASRPVLYVCDWMTKLTNMLVHVMTS